MKLPDFNEIKDKAGALIRTLKIKFSKLDVRDKNNLILVVSAGLIVLAVIIAIIGNVASKNKDEKVQPSVQETVAAENNKPESNDDKNDNKVSASNGGIYRVITQNDPLTIRLTPSTSASAVDGIAKDSEIEILGVYTDSNGDKFGFVIIGGSSGWVNMKYTEFVSASTVKTVHGTGKYTVNSYDGELSIRRRPDDSNLGTAIPNGTEVNIISVCQGNTCEWGLVEYNGEVGWLPFTYLK